ncbi:MAG TPA: ThiF family adenylyltransferase [Kofleriaceae bacterium]|nr:ThiF family adenylyltransferase [Kofleriaceae bacterium]
MLRATVIGAGGLGGPIALSLGVAGLELTIVDPDVVELSNLHRQVQFTAADIGQPKASRLAARVVARGGAARAVCGRWAADTADELGADADLVIDGSDDPATKFAVADWAVAHGRCYVIAAALRYGGNAMVGAPGAACYRCLFEAPVDAPSCADAGVLGPVVGAIGGAAAAYALALVHGDRHHAGALVVFDDLRRSADPRIVRFAPRADCPACTRAPISPFVTPVRVAEPPDAQHSSPHRIA